MKKMVSATLFFVIFHGLFFGMQYFVARYLYNLVNEEMTRFALSFLILGTLSFSAASMCIRFSTQWFWRQFYKLSSYWMGTVFILFTVVMGERLLNLFLPIPKLLSLILISVSFILVFTQAMIGGNKLELKIVKTPSKKAKMPIRFVQLSDIHLGAINRKNELQRLVSQTNILNPDFVVITGDLFDGNCEVEQEILEPLNSLVSPVYFVTGNHDYYQGVDVVRKQLSKTKVIMLEDAGANLPSVQIIGASYSLDKDHHEKVMADVKVAKDKPSIFLYHTPTDLLAAVKHNVDLQLAGHTHRGQIWPFRLLVRLNFKYVYGHFREKNSFIYVAPGSATWGPKMKLGSHNEITLHIIEPAKK